MCKLLIIRWINSFIFLWFLWFVPGLGTEAEKVEKLSPLFFSTPRNSLVCWAQRPIPSNRNLHKLLRVIFPEVLMEYFEISCWHDDFMKTLPGTFRLQEWNCDFTWFYWWESDPELSSAWQTCLSPRKTSSLVWQSYRGNVFLYLRWSYCRRDETHSWVRCFFKRIRLKLPRPA